MQKRDLARRIISAFETETSGEPSWNRYNVFVFHDGHISFEPVTGLWGCGVPAYPDEYATFLLDVPAGVLQEEYLLLEWI